MDHLKTALTQLATLSERRIFRLTHGKLSKNLPSFLVDGTGLNSGFMLAQYTAAALASEMKGLAHPASVDTIPTVQHHEDHVSMSPIAGRMALDSLECLADVIAIELLVGAQALDLRFRDDQIPPPDRLQQLHTHIRKVVSFWHDDEVLHPSISAMSHMVSRVYPSLNQASVVVNFGYCSTFHDISDLTQTVRAKSRMCIHSDIQYFARIISWIDQVSV